MAFGFAANSNEIKINGVKWRRFFQFAGAKKMLNKMLNKEMLEFSPIDWDAYYPEAFSYVIKAGSTNGSGVATASGITTDSFTILSDAPFILSEIHINISGAPLLSPELKYEPSHYPFRVNTQIYDTGVGTNLFTREMPVRSLGAVNGIGDGVQVVPRILAANSAMEITTNNQDATAWEIFYTLRGVKLKPRSNQVKQRNSVLTALHSISAALSGGKSQAFNVKNGAVK